MVEKKKTVPLRIMVSSRLHDYLSLLKDTTMLGASENDVAAFLLTQRLEAMLAERYHENQKVPKE
ncbi:hypothetical protein [Methyloligella solikamskensis]|uniref:Uncharacterized protein n=1 Tax=Methyloligella solikamskensis TaxID=1177756 RepID=A0ABW3J6Z7_9HYPH